MPPDDPASYDLSPNPQKPGKAGIARIEGTGYLELIAQWDQENRERKAHEEDAEKQKNAEPAQSEEQEEGAKVNAKGVSKPGPAIGQGGGFAKDVSVGPTVEGMPKTAPANEDAIAVAKARSAIDITGRPAYLLTLDQAAELAMFNSREYQDQRENLYIAALPVTLERFSFMAQWFAGQEASRAYFGSGTPTGQSSNWSLNNGLGFSKILPTGALLLFNFSNQTVFNFLNPKQTLSVTTLNFDAIQPLLRGGGQAVALESLTQAERNLLYAIRRFARFRKELYVAIASNNGGSISGGTFQPVGVLSNNNAFETATGPLGASGLTPGVIPPPQTGITSAISPPLSPGSLTALVGAITPPPAGYLSTMLEKVQVSIDQENIDVLSVILLRFRGLLEGDVVAPLQIQSVEQQLLTGRATLLLDQTQYLAALDAFKNSIGVPMKLSIEMDDSVMRPLLNQFRRARAITDNEQLAVTEAAALLPLEKAPLLRAELLRLFTKSALVKGTNFGGGIRARLAEWEMLSNKEVDARLEGLRKEVQKFLDLQTDLQLKGQTMSQDDAARLRSTYAQLDLGNFERALRQYEANFVDMGKPKKPDASGERQRLRQFQNVISSWQKVLVEARDEQWTMVRSKWPELPRCCVDGVDLVHDDLTQVQATAAKRALENRLDLMNVRAQVVDAWRQLAVYANALLGTFNVRYHLSANSPLGGAQPTNIGGSRTSHELFLDTELPLVRVQEAEDLTVQAVNGELYVLRQLADQYRLQQRQLELAYLTIDSSLESLQAPIAPAAPVGQTRSGNGADGPAALTQQLLSAQRSLPSAQNALLALWINYLNARLQLYRDLELMPLDARGVWIDEIRACDCGIASDPPAESGRPAPEKLPLLPLPVDGMK